MEIFDTTMRALDAALGAAGKRQEVLANNLANVNTPGYKRMDVNFDDTLAQAIASAKSGEASNDDVFGSLLPQVQADRNAVSVRADGNSVDVDQEMSFLAENNIRYNALVQLSSNKIDTLKYVISDGR